MLSAKLVADSKPRHTPFKKHTTPKTNKMYKTKSKLGLVAMLSVIATGSSFATQVFDGATNGAMATAQNLDASFSSEFVADIYNSTTVPHATATRLFGGATQYDWFTFTAAAGKVITLDIDQGMNDLDSYLRVYKVSDSSFVTSNDDSSGDPGSIHPFDSFLSFLAPFSGLYAVEVAQWVHSPISGSQDYNLHVSVQDHVAASAPDGGSTIALLGLAMTAIAGARRKFAI